MNFFRLFQNVILRHLRYEWGKLLLAIAGVAIGVAVFVSIRLANTTAFQAFTTSLDVVTGKANLQALSNDGLGFDERFIVQLRRSPAVIGAAPAIEQYAQVEDSLELARPGSGTPLLVFGIDVFAENAFRTYEFQESAAGGDAGLQFLLQRNAIIITDKLARQYNLQRGDSIRLVANGARTAFQVVGIVKPEGTASALGGNFALLDIASAQEVFGRIGRLDRIDLLVPAEEREQLREYLAETAPPGVVVREPQSRGAEATRMLESFDLNLTALAFIALFVSMFIIYNTMLTNTLRRRRELGILRALGATRSTIVALFLGEATLIGLLGVAVGLPVGIMLARLALDQVTRTITALYILTVTDELAIDPATLVLGGVIGLLASVVSALPAALEGARAHPRETFSVQTFETKVSLNLKRIFTGTALALIAAYAASYFGEKLMSPELGFASAGLLLLGVALLTPAVVSGAGRLFGRVIRRLFGVEGELANAYLLASLGRSSTAIAALMTAIAMLIGVSTMVDSFRRTVEYWMRQTVTADLYITVASNRLSAAAVTPIPEPVWRYVDTLQGVRIVDALRRLKVGYQDGSIFVSGATFNAPESDAPLAFQEGGRWNDIMSALDSGAVVVSEGFGMRYGKGMGDTITIATPSGPQSFRIAGIFYDYSSDAGSVMLKREPFMRLFADSALNSIAIHLRDPSVMEQVRENIERSFAGRYSLVVYSNRALRADALDIFDQTFAITYALQLVAVIVAAIGVANTLAALVVERSREIGILKAVGATAGQIRKMTLVQAGLIGAASQFLGAGAGLLLSMILIYVINRVSFGWTIQLTISPEILVLSGLLVILTAFLAGLVPANAAARKPVADVVKAE